MVERQVDRLAGHRDIDESAKFKAMVLKLESALEAAKADALLLTQQLDISTKGAGGLASQPLIVYLNFSGTILGCLFCKACPCEECRQGMRLFSGNYAAAEPRSN